MASANLEAGSGGIARVGRVSLRAVMEAGYPVSTLSFSGKHDFADLEGVIKTSDGSKLRFLASHLTMLPRHDFVLYDHVGLARGRGFVGAARRRPFGVWIHGNEVWENLRPSHKEIIRAAKLVLVNSRYTLDRYVALHGPLPQARVCHLATEYDQAGWSEDKIRSCSLWPTVLVLGRAEKDQPGKGHKELIDCWQQVVASVPKAKLLIVGRGGGIEALKIRAAQSPARESISFPGFIADSEIDQLWDQADVLAMPSRQEGFGIVYVEAMARRKAILASVHDAGQEVNLDGVTGFNINLNDPAHMIDCLTRLLVDQGLRDKMGAAGYARWKKHFQYECFKKRFLDILTCLHETGINATCDLPIAPLRAASPDILNRLAFWKQN